MIEPWDRFQTLRVDLVGVQRLAKGEPDHRASVPCEAPLRRSFLVGRVWVPAPALSQRTRTVGCCPPCEPHHVAVKFIPDGCYDLFGESQVWLVMSLDKADQQRSQCCKDFALWDAREQDRRTPSMSR